MKYSPGDQPHGFRQGHLLLAGDAGIAFGLIAGFQGEGQIEGQTLHHAPAQGFDAGLGDGVINVLGVLGLRQAAVVHRLVQEADAAGHGVGGAAQAHDVFPADLAGRHRQAHLIAANTCGTGGIGHADVAPGHGPHGGGGGAFDQLGGSFLPQIQEVMRLAVLLHAGRYPTTTRAMVSGSSMPKQR